MGGPQHRGSRIAHARLFSTAGLPNLPNSKLQLATGACAGTAHFGTGGGTAAGRAGRAYLLGLVRRTGLAVARLNR